MNISELKLKPHTRNLLIRAGFQDAETLAKTSIPDLIQVRQLSYCRIKEVKEALHRAGLIASPMLFPD